MTYNGLDHRQIDSNRDEKYRSWIFTGITINGLMDYHSISFIIYFLVELIENNVARK